MASIQTFIARNSLIITIIMGASAILGLAREASIAYMFGASGQTDAYLIAMIIPTLASGLISGSITSTFVTVYSSFLARQEYIQAQRLANITLSLFVLILGGVSAVFLFDIPLIIHLIAPSYSGQYGALTVELTRMLIPNLFFGGLLGVLVGINNSHHSFIAPAAVGLVANLLMLTAIFTLGKIWGIYSLAVGAVAGVLAQFLMQIWAAYRHGFRYQFIIDLRDAGIREILFLVTPFIFSTAAGQVNLIVDRTLATGLPTGAVSALYFADKLVFLPSLFTASIGTVVFPLLVNAATLEDWPRVVEGINRAVRLLTLALYPAVVGIYVLRVPFISMLFERGAFTPADTIIVANTVPYFLGALFFGALSSIFANIFLAMKKMHVPVVTAVISVCVNIGFSLLLINHLQQYGLALANSLAALANLILLISGLFFIIKLHRKTILPYRELSIFFGQVGIAGVATGAVVWAYCLMIQGYFTGFTETFMVPISAVMVGVVAYLILTYILRVEEVQKGVDWVIARTIKRGSAN
jgi:putative peptidoglycan lipid II flippase